MGSCTTALRSLCCFWPRRQQKRSPRGRETAELLQARRKYGAVEVQELLEEVKAFSSARLQRFVPDADEASSSSVSPSSSPRGNKVDTRMIDNYLDALGAANESNRYVLVLKGPLAVGETQDSERTCARQLDALESLLLDETDSTRFTLAGVKVSEVEVKAPLTAFLNNLLGSGTVNTLSFTNCSITPHILAGGLTLYRYSSITSLSFRSCGLVDAHLSLFTKALLENTSVLASLQALDISGSFSERVLDELLQVLEAEAPELRYVGFPKRHEGLVKKHSLCDSKPHLYLNGKKVRHKI
eukprot:Sspe_Gene.76782::Locus_47966_Transcript_1_1_Confidence_1.000_Length_1341::g.76782::m.76782